MEDLPRSSGGDFDLPSTLEFIRSAAGRLAPYVRETPTVYSYTFSESAGCDVWLKLENLQRTGSFKLRGALNKLLSMSPEQRQRGLVAASAGNHAQGVALAAQLLGSKATIVMPVHTAMIKIRRTEDYGASVILHGTSWDESQARALELGEEHGWTPVHPFDDPAVIIGQGTVALEILEQVPEVETLVVPVGGGGLLAGVALAVKAVRPEVRIVGVQAAGAASMVASLAAGERRSVEHPTTLAEGIRVGRVGELTFEVVRRLVDEVVTVEERDLVEAMVQTLEKSKVLPEGAGVAPIAALVSNRIRVRGRICAVVSGGNIDLNQLGRLIESGLAEQGFTHLVRLRMSDVSGQLYSVVSVLAEAGCNIRDVQHYRGGWRVPVGCVDVEILVETRRAGQGVEVEELLRSRGFELPR
jgi:threonine dehydratase